MIKYALGKDQSSAFSNQLQGVGHNFYSPHKTSAETLFLP